MTDTRHSFRNYNEFFAYYMRQHSDARNRRMHAYGTILGLVILITTLALGHPWLALSWIPTAYGFAWAGHFLIEGNRPATFGHPGWAFISDFRMLALMLTGRLGPWLSAGSRDETPVPAAKSGGN